MDEKTLIRKLRNRKQAYIYTGQDENFDYSELQIGDINDPEELLEDNLQRAYESRNLEFGYDFWIKQASMSKTKVFMKKVLKTVFRKCFGFLINPLIDQQNIFNGNAINSVSVLRQLVSLMGNKIDVVDQKLVEQSNEIDQKCEEQIKQIVKEQDRINEQNKMIIDSLSTKVLMLQKELEQKDKIISSISEHLKAVSDFDVEDSVKKNEQTYLQIDYFDFENRFRGTREHVKKVQEIYLPYYKDCKKVLDIGSGRGEFLELMKEHGINAIGVDNYQEFVDFCNNRGLFVEYGDGLDYLENIESVDGIFAGQIVEHLKTEQILKLCKLAYDKLEDGGYVILETPNPQTLAIFNGYFYVDPSHQKPVHPSSLWYYLEKAGFSKIDVIYTDSSKVGIEIPPIEGFKNAEEFNEKMQLIQDVLFGSQDYAIVAQK